MKKIPIPTPKELTVQKVGTKQVSTRIREDSYNALEAAAEKEGVSLSYLTGRVLEYYADSLKKTTSR